MRHWLALALCATAAPAAAGTINFEEIPATNRECCYLTEEYAHLGIHFLTRDDGAIWDGMVNGDPGYWFLNGSDGPAFLGLNGRSYVVRARFDKPIVDFSLDAARGWGSTGQSIATIQGYRDGVRVEKVSVELGPVNEWVRLGLTEVVDFVRILNEGTDPNRNFAIDALSWSLAEPPMVSVTIDIRPDSEENPVHPGSRGVIPVLLLGSADLAVWDVDAETLAFGPGAAARAHENGPHYCDANEDGWLDLLAHFRTQDTAVSSDDAELCLGGALLDGTPLEGCDAVTVVGADEPAPDETAGRAKPGRGRGRR